MTFTDKEIKNFLNKYNNGVTSEDKHSFKGEENDVINLDFTQAKKADIKESKDLCELLAGLLYEKQIIYANITPTGFLNLILMKPETGIFLSYTQVDKRYSLTEIVPALTDFK